MTKASYSARGDSIHHDNPLIAALPLQDDVRRAFCDSFVKRLGTGCDTMLTARETISPGRQDSKLVTTASLLFFDAVHDSLLDGYRDRNPMAMTTPGYRIIAFGSAPITVLTWQSGGDQVAKELFDRVLGGLPTVVDHLGFKGRAFITRQLIRAAIQVDPLNAFRGTCLQIVKAADAAFGTDQSSRLTAATTNLALALGAAHACGRTSLGLLGIHVPTLSNARDAEDLWDLAMLLQMRCGIALLVCCSEFVARWMAKGGPSGRRFTDAKHFVLSQPDLASR